MTAERFWEIQSRGGVLNLSDHAKFRLTGADRVRYLNGQVTNDVRQASDRRAVYACVTDVKGRTVGDVFVRADGAGDSLYLDAIADLREVLGPRLERYIIADDVELTDVTEEWQLWHVFGPAAESGIEGVECLRMGCLGRDLWVPRESKAPEWTVPILTGDEAEQWRILHGIPKYPQELSADVFPPEAGLDDRAMSYTKGCYIGQEILSRIRTTGKMPRRLVKWTLVDRDLKVEPGFEFRQAGAAVSAGVVTSVTIDPRHGGRVGLGYVKSGVLGEDSQLLVGGGEPRIEGQVKISPFVNQ